VALVSSLPLLDRSISWPGLTQLNSLFPGKKVKLTSATNGVTLRVNKAWFLNFEQVADLGFAPQSGSRR
jgi:hypothetical protein